MTNSIKMKTLLLNGTNTGKLFGSDDEGDSWRTIAENLPPVYSVATAVI